MINHPLLGVLLTLILLGAGCAGPADETAGTGSSHPSISEAPSPSPPPSPDAKPTDVDDLSTEEPRPVREEVSRGSYQIVAGAVDPVDRSGRTVFVGADSEIALPEGTFELEFDFAWDSPDQTPWTFCITGFVSEEASFLINDGTGSCYTGVETIAFTARTAGEPIDRDTSAMTFLYIRDGSGAEAGVLLDGEFTATARYYA